ncbi:MAG: ribosome maturation factor, partial [Chitinophagaceae bacterium]
METVILKEKIESLVEGLLSSEPEYFLVDVKIKPVNNIRVFVDGDNGISIEKCTKFSKKLLKSMEEEHIPESGDYALEFSSPGIGEPLKLHRQYLKNIGRKVEVTLADGTTRIGALKNVEAESINITQVSGKSKKTIVEENVVIPFDQILKTLIQ